MVEIFQRLMTDNKTHIQESQKGSSKINFEKPYNQNILFKLKKIEVKEKILKRIQRKNIL